MRIRNEVYTNLGRRGLVVALRLWEGWTYSANPITSWIKRLVLQRGVVCAVEICRIKGVEAYFGQIHAVETEHHHLDRSILFQLLRMAYICSKTVDSSCVLGPEARKARGGRGPTRGPLSGRFPVSKRGRRAIYSTCPKIAKDF